MDRRYSEFAVVGRHLERFDLVGEYVVGEYVVGFVLVGQYVVGQYVVGWNMDLSQQPVVSWDLARGSAGR